MNRFPHAPVDSEEGCLSCHSPHSAISAGLVNKTDGELCFECHADVREAGMKSVIQHSPFTENMCTSCHNPHGSSAENMLTGDRTPFACRVIRSWLGSFRGLQSISRCREETAHRVTSDIAPKTIFFSKLQVGNCVQLVMTRPFFRRIRPQFTGPIRTTNA